MWSHLHWLSFSGLHRGDRRIDSHFFQSRGRFWIQLVVPLFCNSLFTIWILPLSTTPSPCKRRGDGYRNREGERDIASVCTVYNLFSCWYCWSLLQSVWLPVWLTLTGAMGATAAMVATVAVMAEDMGAMVDMAAATAVMEAMVATVVVITAERHSNTLLSIDTVWQSPLCVAWGLLQKTSNTWNCPTSGQLGMP